VADRDDVSGVVTGDDPTARQAGVTTVSGKYRLLRLLGSGGMGEVHEAEHLILHGKRVAVKLLHRALVGHAKLVERFLREAQTAARLRHPGIVAVLDVETDARLGPALVMELLEGTTVEALLKEGPLPITRALDIADQALAALAAAHTAGVVHRDIKPANLFLARQPDGDAQLKILDFGIAQVAAEASLTEPGMFVGTPRYASPEQRGGLPAIDARTDLYSLAAVVFEMLTGRILGSLAGDPIALVATLERAGASSSLGAVLLRALAPRVEERFADAAAMRAALAEARRDVRADAVASARARPRRWWLVAAPVALLLAVGLVALGRGAGRLAPSPTVAAAGDTTRILDAACRAWTQSLVARQTAEGGFSGLEYYSPSGGDTAQQLAALEAAKRACRALEPGVELRALAALGAMRRPEGWAYFLQRDQQGYANVAATSWAALAFTWSEELGHDPAAKSGALAAREVLLGAQLADGGFALGLAPSDARTASAFVTMLALWALADGERLDASERGVHARRAAAAWLRRSLRGEAGVEPVRATPGLEEQAAWVLWHARTRNGERDPGDAQLGATAAADLVGRCALSPDGARCTHPLYGNGKTNVLLDPRYPPMLFVTNWFPWTLLTARALRADCELPLDADERARLAQVEAWGLGQVEAGTDGMSAKPAYELAEYLFAVAALEADGAPAGCAR
jgi:serine/threonine-protein kinase